MGMERLRRQRRVKDCKSMKRKRDRDEWLWDRIDEDLTAMADEREKLLMESEELQNVKVPEGMLENIHRELEIRNGTARKFRIRRRMVIAVAAAAVSCVGFGVIGYGNREYEPEIIEREVGDDTTTKINNSEAIASGYDEDEVCQEIQEKLGVIPVQLAYQPKGMYLENYWIDEETREAIIKYSAPKGHVHVYISKDYKESSVNYETDKKERDTLIIDSNRLEIKVYEYEDSSKTLYYISSFKYLNTYYSVHGMIEYDEFIKILENIAIENV
ncbi:MAG: DUF4367 domain-containing protein [Lachnospiraceae bacterium]|nr:DUF4367 domain-containing protein [Lachnospiraceae bacterium]